MQGLQEQNGHVSRPARMRLWTYSMEHTGGTTEVPNYCYQISDAGTVKKAILWGNQIISSWSFIFCRILGLYAELGHVLKKSPAPSENHQLVTPDPPQDVETECQGDELISNSNPKSLPCLQRTFSYFWEFGFQGVLFAWAKGPNLARSGGQRAIALASAGYISWTPPNQITWQTKPQADRERPVYWAGTIGDSGPILNWFFVGNNGWQLVDSLKNGPKKPISRHFLYIL